MPKLPLVIVCENHIDYNLHLAYRSMFNAFQALGYDTLCHEHPSSLSAEALIDILTETEQVTTANAQTCVNMINRHSQHKYSVAELLRLKYLELASIIEKYVSQKDCYDIAYNLRSRLPNQQLLANLKAFRGKLNILGIDVERDFEPLHHGPHNQRRELHMAAELAKHYNSGKNIICTVGKIHLFGLYRELAKHNLLEQTIFLDMYSIDTQEFELTAEEQEMLVKIKSKVHIIDLGAEVTIDLVWPNIKKLIDTHCKQPVLSAYELARTRSSIGLACFVIDKFYPYNKFS